MKKIGPWKQLSSRTAYKNHWIRIREDKVIRPDGKPGLYGVVEAKHPSVFVVALTSEDEILVLHTFRYTSQVYTWEVPAGSTDGQPPLQAAKRELREETGYQARLWKKLGKIYSINGISNEQMHIYLARDLFNFGHNQQKEEGIIEVRALPASEILKWIKSGKITDGQCISALFFAFAELNLIRS